MAKKNSKSKMKKKVSKKLEITKIKKAKKTKPKIKKKYLLAFETGGGTIQKEPVKKEIKAQPQIEKISTKTAFDYLRKENQEKVKDFINHPDKPVTLYINTNKIDYYTGNITSKIKSEKGVDVNLEVTINQENYKTSDNKILTRFKVVISKKEEQKETGQKPQEQKPVEKVLTKEEFSKVVESSYKAKLNELDSIYIPQGEAAISTPTHPGSGASIKEIKAKYEDAKEHLKNIKDGLVKEFGGPNIPKTQTLALQIVDRSFNQLGLSMQRDNATEVVYQAADDAMKKAGAALKGEIHEKDRNAINDQIRRERTKFLPTIRKEPEKFLTDQGKGAMAKSFEPYTQKADAMAFAYKTADAMVKHIEDVTKDLKDPKSKEAINKIIEDINVTGGDLAYGILRGKNPKEFSTPEQYQKDIAKVFEVYENQAMALVIKPKGTREAGSIQGEPIV